MPPETTLWELEPHTVGKHLVLRHYLDTWLPIMLNSEEIVYFIDTFAGPGMYQGGEPGSPLIAIERYINHSLAPYAKGKISFRFIEAHSDRHLHLRTLIVNNYPERPPNANWDTHFGKFDETMTNLLDNLSADHRVLPPALVMIDPFGVSDTPMSLIKRILENPKAEIYFTFMYDTVNRFASSYQYPASLTDLFGTEEWREGIDIKNEAARFTFFVGRYKSQLKSVGNDVQLLHFTIDHENRRNYYVIIYATKSTKGSDEMMKAMWDVAPSGNFRFVGGNQDQIGFGEGIVNFEDLQRQLANRFKEQGYLPMDVIEDYVMSDATHFHSGHLRSQALRPMETAQVIDVKRKDTTSGFNAEDTENWFSGKIA